MLVLLLPGLMDLSEEELLARLRRIDAGAQWVQANPNRVRMGSIVLLLLKCADDVASVVPPVEAHGCRVGSRGATIDGQELDVKALSQLGLLYEMVANGSLSSQEIEERVYGGKRAPGTPRVGVHRLDQKLSDTPLRIKRTERGYGLERRPSGTYEVLAVPSEPASVGEPRERAKKRREG